MKGVQQDAIDGGRLFFNIVRSSKFVIDVGQVVNTTLQMLNGTLRFEVLLQMGICSQFDGSFVILWSFGDSLG